MNITLPKFDTVSVLVVGDAILDQYLFGESHRISPEGPIPVVTAKSETIRPGGAANVACNIAALGAKCELLSIVGQDENAKTLDRLLKKWDVSSQFVIDSSAPTIEKTRIVSQGQQIVRIDKEAPFSQESGQEMLDKFSKILGQYNCVVFSDYLKGALTHIPEMISIAKKQGLLTIVDPKSKDFSIYANADVITPNMKEFSNVVHTKLESETHIQTKAHELIEKYNIGSICLTRGAEGISIYSKSDKNSYHLPATSQEVFDVSGAGDCVVAMISTCLAMGHSLKEAAILANIAAGISVRRVGTSVITKNDIEYELLHSLTGHRKHVSWDELKKIVRVKKAKGEKVIFTNGCFDIIHAGHVDYLKKARELGSLLIVGVNSDGSVKRLKGPHRPINTLDDRITVLSALESVDYVTSFDEDTPLELIKTISPDVIAKGGDYTEEQIVGREYVSQNGGSAKVINFLEGYSTSSFIDKIKSQAS